MICTTRDGRKVEVEISYEREPDDTYIASAVYLDADEVVSEEVCEELTHDYAGEIAERWYEHQLGRAEYIYE